MPLGYDRPHDGRPLRPSEWMVRSGNKALRTTGNRPRQFMSAVRNKCLRRNEGTFVVL